MDIDTILLKLKNEQQQKKKQALTVSSKKIGILKDGEEAKYFIKAHGEDLNTIAFHQLSSSNASKATSHDPLDLSVSNQRRDAQGNQITLNGQHKITFMHPISIDKCVKSIEIKSSQPEYFEEPVKIQQSKNKKEQRCCQIF